MCLVCELQNPSMSVFLNGLESSGWMRHIKSIIDASVFVAKVSDNYNYSHSNSNSRTLVDASFPVPVSGTGFFVAYVPGIKISGTENKCKRGRQ